MHTEQVVAALSSLRVPPGTGELDMHARIADGLAVAGIPFTHEAKLAPRCRIDFLIGGIGLEVKCGKPNRTALIRQLSRYAACEGVTELIVVVARSVHLPTRILDKPCLMLSMNRLWGIALS